MTDSIATTADYSKFTVPQLKARCKELKLTGYSKLGKATLLEKHSQYGNTPSTAGTLIAIYTQHTSISLPASNDGTSSFIHCQVSLPSVVTPAAINNPDPISTASHTDFLTILRTKTSAASLRKKQKLGNKAVTNLPKHMASSAAHPPYVPQEKFGFADSAA
ncbi:uncharacterized protein FOMMEDRAFT_162254 [Fomitiporia mediterranea MF3/22]|uniref:uncharacterized protein n=1 Tax=Fomitiporia mediterranea (strain MF3/22) TaxID=694068 RepID=UPI0004409604|nr:uncharacterized protein FOMMEDRAFT_162254 [Fomitiporia mediterranea MF3/22]EJC97911.1 hypothetical protein FOMMEDRAFT_162254 [Fomitiporia mediterranea MF3/22]